MKTLTWQKPGQQNVAQELIKIIINYVAELRIEFLRQMAGCKAYASTAGFESVCEAMYLGKPILMVPAHIEQECNAFDAMQNGAGIIDHNFNLSNLLRFSQNYKPNRLFVEWVKSAEYIILNEIERFAPQNTLQGMYLVEEFV